MPEHIVVFEYFNYDFNVLFQTLLLFIIVFQMEEVEDWNVDPKMVDYHQNIARAAFADMLYDSDRVSNYMY